MKIFKYITYVALLGFLGSCTKSDIEEYDVSYENRQEISVRSEIDQIYQTRVSDMGFVDGDVIGLSVVNYTDSETSGEFLSSGNHVDNMKFTYNEESNKWSGEKTIYWSNSAAAADFYSYYPYAEEMTSISAYPFAVTRNQSTSAENGNLGGYEASDFLWAKAEGVTPTSSSITLTHNHIMATIQVTLVEGEEFEPGLWAELTKDVVVLNTKRNTTIDLSTGVATAISGDGDDSGIIPYINDDSFRAIVAPQSVTASTVLFAITVDGQSYEFIRSDEMVYYPGKMHNFTISVDSKTNYGDYKFSLVEESITAWENDSVSHDGEAKEYLIVESPTRGGLESVITELGINPKDISNLKISGEMNGDDFTYINENITYLEAVNLKDVRLYDCWYSYDDWINDSWTRENIEDDIIPLDAFSGTSHLTSVVFPDVLKKIGADAFGSCPLKGSLTIPEGVTHLGGSFQSVYLDGTLTLPTTLEVIEGSVFYHYSNGSAQFTNELVIPESVTYIGEAAFSGCCNMTGTLKLPSGLTEVYGSSFNGMSGLSGHLTIPDNVREIGEWAFAGTGFTSISIPESVNTIGDCAFTGSKLKGELVLPSKISTLGASGEGNWGMFQETDITSVVFPEDLEILGYRSFYNCVELQDTISFSSKLRVIEEAVFSGCSKIEAVILPENLESISSGAFSGCYSLNYVQCLGETPPTLDGDVFDGVAKDNFTVVVPESALETYKSADVWSEFKRISAYVDFVCRPMMADVLNAGATREIILNATESWSVTSIPDWCSISQTSGTSKTALTVVIDEMRTGESVRTGEIIFTHDDDPDVSTNYTITQYDYQYEEDECITLQTATKGDGIDIFIVGDGYNAADIAAGTYLDDMKQSVEYFFDIEPYNTYKEYFNVYTAFAMSYESGIGTVNTIRDVKFGTVYGGTDDGRLSGGDYDIVDYTLEYSPITESNLNEALIILIPNTTIYDGVCVMWEDGTAIAYCPKSEWDYPYDARGLVQHEAGGHGFGKLGDEYIYHSAYIQLCTCFCCGHVDELQENLDRGWHRNLSLTGTYGSHEWRHLIFDDRYSDIVDLYSGGYFHSAGVYRSEYNSCMNNNVPYYSTISRQAIVERIMELSGGTFDFETFVANDSRDYGQDFTLTRSGTTDVDYPVTRHLNAPVVKQGSPLNR